MEAAMPRKPTVLALARNVGGYYHGELLAGLVRQAAAGGGHLAHQSGEELAVVVPADVARPGQDCRLAWHGGLHRHGGVPPLPIGMADADMSARALHHPRRP